MELCKDCGDIVYFTLKGLCEKCVRKELRNRIKDAKGFVRACEAVAYLFNVLSDSYTNED